MIKKAFKWTVEFTVDETWVADGFDLNEERALGMVENALPFAYEHEFSAKVIKSPEKSAILKAQGYTDAA